MGARDKLYAVASDDMPVTGEEVNEAIDAYAHELAERQRDRLAAGFRMTGFATVLCSNGQHEPMGVTHIIDGIDPECGGRNRPAREALAEIRQREPWKESS